MLVYRWLLHPAISYGEKKLNANFVSVSYVFLSLIFLLRSRLLLLFYYLQ